MDCLRGEERQVADMDLFDRLFVYPLEQLPFLVLVLLIAFTAHEFAHAYAAYKFGDPTAQRMGRLTLNPRAHLDLFGTLLILLVGFGWAKPVPVNRSYFKHPRLMGIVVSFVGPLSNLLIAFVGLLLFAGLLHFGALEHASVGVQKAVQLFFSMLVQLNALLFIFNLIPLPPLDGYRIVEDLAPTSLSYRMAQYEHWGIYVFLLLIFIPPLYRVTLQPILLLSRDLVYGMSNLVGIIF